MSKEQDAESSQPVDTGVLEAVADTVALGQTEEIVQPVVKTADEMAFDELQAAAAEGNAALNKELLSEGLPPIQDKESLTPEQKAKDEAERRKRFGDNAQSQRERGKKEFAKVYTGVMSMKVEVKINDLSIASSLERFVGLIDKNLFQIARNGERAIGEKEANKIMMRLSELIDEFAQEAANEASQAKILLDVEKAKVDDLAFGEPSAWLAPEYQTSVIEIGIHLKHPDSLKMVRALQVFDKLIHDLTVLLWNGSMDKSRIDQIRQRQNTLARKVFLFSISSINGMSKRMGRKK